VGLIISLALLFLHRTDDKAPPVAAGGALVVHYRPGIPGAAVEVESGTDADAGVKTSAPLACVELSRVDRPDACLVELEVLPHLGRRPGRAEVVHRGDDDRTDIGPLHFLEQCVEGGGLGRVALGVDRAEREPLGSGEGDE
jgi:hypothetical protein